MTPFEEGEIIKDLIIEIIIQFAFGIFLFIFYLIYIFWMCW